MDATRLCTPLRRTLGLVCLAVAPLAAAQIEQEPAPVRLAVTAVEDAAHAGPAVQTLAWLGGTRLRLGLGVQQGTEAHTPTRGVLALGLRRSARTDVALESQWERPRTAVAAGLAPPTHAHPLSVGLAVHSRSASPQGLRSLTRVQLSSDASVQWRPRRGGLLVSYSSTW